MCVWQLTPYHACIITPHSLESVGEHGYIITPGRYVGFPEPEEDDEPFDEKMARLTKALEEQFAEDARLQWTLHRNLGHLGFMSFEEQGG